MYEIREAREEDREQTVEMLVRVFKEIDDFDESWIESWMNYMNKPENEDWNFVATFNDEVVANLAFFANSNNSIRNAQVRFGGVWAVATDPNHRRKGLLRGIYEKAFSFMKSKEIVLSILEPSEYPGAQIAYEQIGYAAAERRVRHEFRPYVLRPSKLDSSISRRVITDTSDLEKISALAKSMCRFGSRVFTWPGFLIGGLKAGFFHLFEHQGKPVGCMNLGFSNSTEGKTMHIMNAYYTSNDVLPSMMETILDYSSDVEKITWACDVQIPLREYSRNVRNIKSQNVGAMMMRVVDFEGFCNSIKVPELVDTEITLLLEDVLCPWNAGSYKLRASNGHLVTDRVEESRPDVTLSAFQLSNVIAGLMGPKMLRELDLIQCSEETATILEEIFPLDSFNSYFRF